MRPHKAAPTERESSKLDVEQDNLRMVEHLLARQKLVEDLVRRQGRDGPRQQVVEGMVHKRHLAELELKLSDMSPDGVARILEALPPDESLVVVRFRNPKGVDFPYFLNMIPNSFMSRPNNLVVPGGKMGFAMEVILGPIIERLVESRNS